MVSLFVYHLEHEIGEMVPSTRMRPRVAVLRCERRVEEKDPVLCPRGQVSVQWSLDVNRGIVLQVCEDGPERSGDGLFVGYREGEAVGLLGPRVGFLTQDHYANVFQLGQVERSEHVRRVRVHGQEGCCGRCRSRARRGPSGCTHVWQGLRPSPWGVLCVRLGCHEGFLLGGLTPAWNRGRIPSHAPPRRDLRRSNLRAQARPILSEPVPAADSKTLRLKGPCPRILDTRCV